MVDPQVTIGFTTKIAYLGMIWGYPMITRSSVAQVVVGGLFGGTLKHFGDHVLAQETHSCGPKYHAVIIVIYK